MEPKQYRVGVLGATGAVGQHLVSRLADHPWFTLAEVVASERSAGRSYGEAVRWRLDVPMPAGAGGLMVKDLQSDLECDLLLSALDAGAAAAEEEFASAGFPVVSNSSLHRMDVDVPLIIPEVNPGHLRAISSQRARRGFTTGLIVTNPNCSTVGLAMALKPLHDAFGIAAVQVVTMQAISGAGLDGVSGFAIQDNVIPHIGGEEEKLEAETAKILGGFGDGGFSSAEVAISAQCNRVAVLDGHTESISVRLSTPATAGEVRAALSAFAGEVADLGLPSSPRGPILVRDEPDRPQPRLDRYQGGGMTVVVGRLRPCPVMDWKFTALVHNMIRGAAGAALLNAELLVAQGFL
ncbi:MAG: aspartate-semialdehyde dehydrogenase [Candidatus Dormibacteria bacterium]